MGLLNGVTALHDDWPTWRMEKR
ncbi:uncharacterized protein G2W53_000009 [Senna tora]|uniref:Uncharacterized protein n=1 Tax=Senna tora TaxID=362788 RepID=A0A835CI22_9FABA|nr:uncharacterized protein G2W53_000009 [Senna tora]